MSKRVSIIQSNYIPWKGYFDIIHQVDEFVFHDDVRYTKQDWRNRNRIKTPAGTVWLTIPVGSQGHRRICDVELPESAWASQHWRRIAAAYGAAPYFDRFRAIFEEVFRRPWRYLSDLNQHLVRTIARDILGLTTRFRDSREFDLQSRREQRVLDILEQTGATVYLSGPAAQTYLQPGHFAERGVELVWMRYDGYPEYPQLHPPFVHEVTILDLLFHTGPDAPWHIWGWRTG
jgi:hypothetical protein